MSQIWTPGQQQQVQISFQIVENAGAYVLVIVTGVSQLIPLPPGPIDQIEQFCGAILGACKAAREQKAAQLAVTQSNRLVIAP